MNTEYIKELLRQQREICANVNWYYASLSVGKRNILNAPFPTIDEEKLVSGLTVEELEGLKQENEHLKFVVEQLEFEKQLSPKADEEKLSGVAKEGFDFNSFWDGQLRENVETVHRLHLEAMEYKKRIKELEKLSGVREFMKWLDMSIKNYQSFNLTDRGKASLQMLLDIKYQAKRILSESPAEKEEDLLPGSSSPDCNSVASHSSSSSNSIEQ
jgi:hypothetical protein